LASLLSDATNATLSAAIESGKTFAQQTLSAMAATAQAQSLAANFHPSNHQGLATALHAELGNQRTKVQLPIQLDRKEVTELDTRLFGSKRSNHQGHNNRLDNGVISGSERVPLQPYKEAYSLGSGVQFFGQPVKVP
jgi:hypothetical protein